MHLLFRIGDYPLPCSKLYLLRCALCRISLLIRLSTYQANALTCIHQIVLPVAHKLDMKQTHKLMGGMLTINLITGNRSG